MAIYLNGKVLYEGQVLCNKGHHNYYDDSDFYALVFDGERVKEVIYATTRHGGGGTAEVDAEDHVIEEAYSWLYNWLYHIALKKVKEEAKKPRLGEKAVVVKGRKVPIGKKGILFWVGEQIYGNKKVEAAGIKDDEGNVSWTYTHNLEAVNQPAKKEIEKEARRRTKLAIEKWGFDIVTSKDPGVII